MEITHQIGICDFIDTRGLKCIYKHNAEMHGLRLPTNIEISKLIGLTYYYKNNNSYIVRAAAAFGYRYNKRHEKPSFVKSKLYFYKADLDKLNNSELVINNEFTSEYGTNHSRAILQDEKFDIVKKHGHFIRDFNVEKYGLVKVLGKDAVNFQGFRYFYLQHQGKVLKRAERAFVMRNNCENSVYHFYKKDIEALKTNHSLETDLQIKMRESCDRIKIDLPPVTPVLTVSPITNDTTVTSNSDRLLQLIIELQETEKKVLHIKQQIKDALGV